MKIRSVLVFAAHYDDETIGAGATLRKWANEGIRVEVAFITNGNTGVAYQKKETAETIVCVRKTEAEIAAKLLGVSAVHHLDHDCQKVCNDQATFHQFIRLIRMVRPDLILTHSDKDKHRDHRIVADLVCEASWKASEEIHTELGVPHRVGDVWAFEIFDLLPRVDFVVDVTDTFFCKQEALAVYGSQTDIIGQAASFAEGLACVRGHGAGVKHAEAFMRIALQPMIWSICP